MLHVELFPRIPDGGRLIIVGDIHGCVNEFNALVEKVRYNPDRGDRLLLLGDLVNKGYDSVGVVRRAIELRAYCILGNHDVALINHMLAPDFGKESDPLWQLAQTFPRDCVEYLKSLPYIYRIPQFNLIAAHAGLNPAVPLENQSIWEVIHMRSIDLTTGMCCEDLRGEPWATQWKGPEKVIFGHDARSGLQVHQFASGIDTGCCYGNALTAVVYPGGDFVSVRSKFKQNKEQRVAAHKAKYETIDAMSPALDPLSSASSPSSAVSTSATAAAAAGSGTSIPLKVSAFADPAVISRQQQGEDEGEANVMTLLSKALQKNTTTANTYSGGVDLAAFQKQLQQNNNPTTSSSSVSATAAASGSATSDILFKLLPQPQSQQQQQQQQQQLQQNQQLPRPQSQQHQNQQNQHQQLGEEEKEKALKLKPTGKSVLCCRALAVRELCGSGLPRKTFEEVVLKILDYDDNSSALDEIISDASIREAVWYDVVVGFVQKIEDGTRGDDMLMIVQDVLSARAETVKQFKKNPAVMSSLQSKLQGLISSLSSAEKESAGLSTDVIRDTLICLK